MESGRNELADDPAAGRAIIAYLIQITSIAVRKVYPWVEQGAELNIACVTLDLGWGEVLMPRHMFRNALAAVIIGAAAYPAAAQDIITVTGPRERVVDRTDFGAEVVEHTASVIVNVRDLNLASAAGRKAMKERLTSASRAACEVVQQRVPIDLRDNRSECARTAYRHAMARIR